MAMPNTLAGKAAIVTGAGQGIGRAIASELAEAGASVIVCDINSAGGESTLREIAFQGASAIYSNVDVRHEPELKGLMDMCVEKFGRLDILVNCARPRLQQTTYEESFNEWDLAMDVLLKAPALAARYALSHMAKNGGGSIINVSSTNADFVSHQSVAYHVAKAGLNQLTRYLAREYGSKNIRVNTVCPGLVDILHRGQPLTANEVNKTVVHLAVPLQRAAKSAEIAKVVRFLCSDDAQYITGSTVHVDGGITVNDHFHIAREAYLAGRK